MQKNLSSGTRVELDQAGLSGADSECACLSKSLDVPRLGSLQKLQHWMAPLSDNACLLVEKLKSQPCLSLPAPGETSGVESLFI